MERVWVQKKVRQKITIEGSGLQCYLSGAQQLHLQEQSHDHLSFTGTVLKGQCVGIEVVGTLKKSDALTGMVLASISTKPRILLDQWSEALKSQFFSSGEYTKIRVAYRVPESIREMTLSGWMECCEGDGAESEKFWITAVLQVKDIH